MEVFNNGYSKLPVAEEDNDPTDHKTDNDGIFYAWLSTSTAYCQSQDCSSRRIWLILTLYIFTLFTFLVVLSRRVPGKPPLTLASDDTFHIAVFADLHYGENESTFGIPADKNSAALMCQVLAQEKPNFVVLNGDLITGENTFAFNSTKYVDQIVEPLVEGGYAWASTYGNHDSKYNLSRQALYAEEAKYPSSYTMHGPPGTDGVTNYVLPIYPYQGGIHHTPVALLWFFDSRGGAEYQHLPANEDNIDNYVSNGTVAWFRSTQANLRVRLSSNPLTIVMKTLCFQYYCYVTTRRNELDILFFLTFPSLL